MFGRVVLHPRAAPSDSLRVWLGILKQPDQPKLTWYLDGAVTEPTSLRNLARAYEYPQSGYTGVMTGLYEFRGLDPGSIHRVQVRVDDTEDSEVLQTRTLPAELGNEPFRVLLASCFAYETDRTGLAGKLVAGLRPQPDLSLLVGDQVYLDQPLFHSLTGHEPTLAQRFERKYLENWTIPVGRAPSGYAQILHVAPTSSVPDDHEFWNNYPQPSVVVPTTELAHVRRSWTNAASAMYSAFQQNATTTSEIINIKPLSFFLMDNRSERSEDFTHSISGDTLKAFEDWTADVAGTRTIPVLITGQSVFQDKKSGSDARNRDSNLANYDDFVKIINGLQMMARAGNPVLLLTGDVHYARILKADLKLTQLTRPNGSIHEIISSPTSLVDMPVFDQWSIITTGSRWKKAPRPDDGSTLAHFPSDLRFQSLYPEKADTRRGDHVAILSFQRNQTGAELIVTYHAVPKPETTNGQAGEPVHISLSLAL